MNSPMSPYQSSSISEEFLRISTKYLSIIDRASRQRRGMVKTEEGTVTLQYFERRPSSVKGSFVVLNVSSGSEFLFVKRSCMRSFFEIRDGDALVGTIKRRGILNRVYSISIEGLGQWNLRIPLFTTRFLGQSKEKKDLWVAIGPSKMEWRIFLDPRLNSPILIAAVAFVHNEYWNHG